MSVTSIFKGAQDQSPPHPIFFNNIFFFPISTRENKSEKIGKVIKFDLVVEKNTRHGGFELGTATNQVTDKKINFYTFAMRQTLRIMLAVAVVFILAHRCTGSRNIYLY